MKFIKKLSKRTRIISLMVLLVMVSTTTIAFLQDYTNTVTNTFSVKSIETEIKENNHDTTLTKMPFVKNIDVTDVMVRIRLDISGDFSNFALAGIDTNYVVGSTFNDQDLIGETKDFISCGKYTTNENTSKYWVAVPNKSEERYSCYYYYKYPLKAKDSKDNDDNPLDVTQPLFDRILLRDDDGFVSYKNANDDQRSQFADLQNVKITIYQESVPLTVTTDNGILNAEYRDNTIIGFDNTNSGTYKIWDYFMKSPNNE